LGIEWLGKWNEISPGTIMNHPNPCGIKMGVAQQFTASGFGNDRHQSRAPHRKREPEESKDRTAQSLQPFQRSAIMDSEQCASFIQHERQIVNVSGDMIELALIPCRVESVFDARENSFAEIGAKMRRTFHLSGHGISNVSKEPFDANISRHWFALEMHYPKFSCL
jgi:hypothetical protein